KHVSVLKFCDIEQLITTAVENTLRRRGLALKGHDLHEEVKIEFLALMRERDTLQATVNELVNEKQALEDNKIRLDRALTATTDQYEQERNVELKTGGEEFDILSAKLEASLRDLLGKADNDSALSDRTIALVTQAIAEQRSMAVEKSRATHEVRLQKLQRRMHRLKRKLQETEDMLQRAQTEPVMSGIPGEPINAGVRTADPAYQTKKELLSEIFKLNVELREILNKD
ncbi:MAG: chromosome segregation ATPase, partial [Pseudohongiellaceae bacterium]